MAENEIKVTVAFNNEMLDQIRAVVREEIERLVFDGKTHCSVCTLTSEQETLFFCGECRKWHCKPCLDKHWLLCILNEEPSDTSTGDTSELTDEELTARLERWKPEIHIAHTELTPEQHKKIVDDVKQSLARDAFLKGQRRVL